MSEREDIIRDVARTLFVCAWADACDAGEVEGPRGGAGEDWMEVAPRRYDPEDREPCGHGVCGDNWCHRVEVPDPAALAEARRIVDAFDAKAAADGAKAAGLEAFSAETLAGCPTPIVDAAELHAELTDTDRFAHSLAMEALGHGVGLEDDMPAGARLPGWIRASVPHSGFSWADLDLAAYEEGGAS